jgi:predicted permease
MTWKDLQLRLQALVHRRRLEQDLEDELKSHIELQTRKNLAQGMSAVEARRQALIEFGGVQKAAEECRDARGVNWITTAFRDAAYAVRGFRRAPLFAITAVATIALGLGIDTALFTVFNAYYFAPVQVRDPHSLYAVSPRGTAYSQTEYREILAQNPPFSEAFAYRDVEVRMNDGRAFGLLVTGEYFRVLGTRPALGRIPQDDSAAGGEPLAVLSYRTWQNRFGADPNIVGKTILLHGRRFAVAGVAQSGFRGLGARPVDFWAPLSAAGRFDGLDRLGPFAIVARLKADYGLTQARASVNLWTQRLAADTPGGIGGVQAVLTPVGTFKPWNSANTVIFAPLVVAFSLVLLLGCANVANMMLARAISRQREFGIRLSLGASRGRMICQFLTESTVLAFPAAATGFVLSQAIIWLCIRVLFATLPPGIAEFTSRLPVLSPDLRVFAYNFAVALAAAFLCGLIPALRAAQGELANALRPPRFRNVLVAGQVTVCVLSLITTGILLHGIRRIQKLDGALSKRDTILIAVQEKFRQRVIDRLGAEPAVETLAAATASPVAHQALAPVAVNHVSPEYFALFDVPVLLGRNFTADEARSGAPVAIVSQTAARRLWPNRNAIGQTLRTSESGLRSAEVIGVARDDLSRWITGPQEPSTLYFPAAARTEGTTLFAGVRGDVETARRTLDADLAAIDPDAVDEIRRFQVRDFVVEEAYTLRVLYWGAGAIGGLALLLTLTGIYGVVAFVVSQRTREIGIRMALGATGAAVTGLMVKQSMMLAAVGIAIGTALALGVSKALASLIVVVNTFDVVTYAGGIAFVLLGCAAASYLPTRRATRIDPSTTLRYE